MQKVNNNKSQRKKNRQQTKISPKTPYKNRKSNSLKVFVINPDTMFERRLLALGYHNTTNFNPNGTTRIIQKLDKLNDR